MIPPIIHVCWDDPDVLNHPSALITQGLRTMRDLNPNWTINISSSDMIDEYLRKQLDRRDWTLLAGTHVVARSDIWRLFKLYHEGGVYIDIDRFCDRSFSDILEPDTRWVLPTQNDFDFSHDFMMSAPGNPAFANAIDMVMQRRRAGVNNIYFLGPQTYMHAVTKTLFGSEINCDPGKETFEEIRVGLSKYPFILTYRETGPYDTIIYRDTQTNLDFEQLKLDFYRSYNITHWTNC